MALSWGDGDVEDLDTLVKTCMRGPGASSAKAKSLPKAKAKVQKSLAGSLPKAKAKVQKSPTAAIKNPATIKIPAQPPADVTPKKKRAAETNPGSASKMARGASGASIVLFVGGLWTHEQSCNMNATIHNPMRQDI